MKLTFLGAAGCVTGSRTLCESNGRRMLVDCGMFQGYKELRVLNWDRFPVRPNQLEAVALTHAHLDHSGWLPRLMREGFDGPVLCTPATKDLARILLEDAAKIQETDARQANLGRYTRHAPARPLFTMDEAKGVLRNFRAVEPGTWRAAGPFRVRFTLNGHILGSAMIEVRADETVLFSGDLGRPNDTVMPAPQPPRECDRLVLESTYGDRTHEASVPARELAALLADVKRRRGILLVPSFAVGRSQALLCLMEEAMADGRLRMPIFLDSPMSAKAMATLSKHIALSRLSPADWRQDTRGVTVVETAQDSQELASVRGPHVLISSSGMATGGRVLHHLARLAPSVQNTILLAGYQAGGTRGAALLNGAKQVKVHGRFVPVRARVLQLENVSAHADQDELLDWASRLKTAPRMTYLNHGEAQSSNALRERLRDELGWDVTIPRMGESFD